MKLPRTIIAVVAVGAATLCACSSAESSGSTRAPEGLVIATTVSPITSIAASIGGNLVRVEGIIPEGTNSHTFEPAPAVAALLSTADLILVNGLNLEDPTLALAATNMKSEARIVLIGNTVLPESDYIYDFSFPKEEGKPNPHLWTDTGYAIKYAALIRDELSALDRTNAASYAANFATFEKQVNELDAAVRKDQQTVPAGNLKLLTYHDAYAYFAKDFGWQVIGAVQPHHFTDPHPADIVALIKQIKAENVKTIFGSKVFPSPVLEEIGRATGARFDTSLRDDDQGPRRPGTDH
jgi:ABC-type Zn uptake system ZnuABC Zn-binding protein ZnuA